MEKALMYLIILLFVAMLFVNVYFRLKVLKTLKTLRQNNIRFDANMVYDRNKLREIASAYGPAQQKDIYQFASYLRKSMSMSILLIVLITAFGAVLMYFRKNG